VHQKKVRLVCSKIAFFIYARRIKIATGNSRQYRNETNRPNRLEIDTFLGQSRGEMISVQTASSKTSLVDQDAAYDTR
jgi:hypothetical protein